MTTTTAAPAGARARQTHYWRVRNGRTPEPPESAPQAWHIRSGHPGGAYSDLGQELDQPEHHAPTLLTRSRRTGRREEEEFRGGCLSCAWEGPVHRGDGYGDGDNQAVEDAHDHAFPGWRELLPVTAVEDRRALPLDRGRWAQLTSCYPPGWLDRGAPLVVASRHRREAHAAPHRGRPRYELRVARPPVTRGKRAADQETLF
ncbi:DUF6349 family protein [Kitasatospora sp. NPDC093550]|uniref:DUF6349 family protein n=1 Tax=Kitasatospora sp. NPDC093550 TaxID=3364089 RepID=UPI0038001195